MKSKTRKHRKKKSLAQPTAAELIGRYGLFTVPLQSARGNPFRVRVSIVDVINRYGRTDVKVKPVGGTGSTWASLANVQLTERY